ncbi:MAG: lipid A deacylase LpxR family protein [Pseudomonadota bacterium]
MTLRFPILGAALVVAFFVSTANADDTAPAVISLTIENDLFGGTDRNYSNGLRLERMASEENTFGILKSAARLLPGIDVDNQVRQGYALSHVIYTPEDISAVIPDPQDRPYAGWLNVSFTGVAQDRDTQSTVQLNLGIVGPSAGADFVQTNWHDLINVNEPRGWDSQLKDEPGIELIGQRQELVGRYDLPLDMRSDVAVHGGLALGNVRTYANVGAMARLGFGADSLRSDFSPPRIRPALSGGGVYQPDDGFGAYLFAGVDVRAIARDIFLDGNTFRDSPSVDDRQVFVGDIQSGIAFRYRSTQVAFTYVHRTEQFRAQDGPQRFGAISLSVAM